MWMYVKGRAVRLGIDEGLLSSELDLIDVSLKRKKNVSRVASTFSKHEVSFWLFPFTLCSLFKQLLHLRLPFRALMSAADEKSGK